MITKVCKPGNFESRNSLKLKFINIQGGVLSNFVDYESFLESNSTDILALCEANVEGSIDYKKFSIKDFLPLIRKNSVTDMHDLAVHVKEEFSFACASSFKNVSFSENFGIIHLERLQNFPKN